ncbi:COMT [Symbiodinium sp. CCMP2456]|nr:COMT [Symbiodinium sp. CCMP2456]
MQGLRPRIRSISGDNEADLVALGESQTVTPTRASKSRDLLSSPLAEVDLGGHVRIEAGYDERELNEVLSFNASIYDLTIQYSCLACTGCGEGQDATVLLNLVLFLGLQVGNVFLQMFLLFEIEFLIAFPAMEHARDLYALFTDHCYGEGLMDSSEDVGILFQSWDGTAKAELCQFPLTNPTFFFMVILIWTFFLGHELKQTVYFFWHTLRLHRPTEGCVCIVDHQDQNQFVITHMSGLLKFWIALIVFLPKFIIAIVLWYIGARWLTATPGVDNLMLNSLALTFICELDELIFRTCTSENIKVVTELGAFVGYSAVRFSSELRRCPGQSSLRLTSLEVNPLHVSVARFLLDIAGLSQVAEVRPGQVKDVVPQLVEELGFHSTGVCFMDHRGTIFHQDFNLLLSHGVLGAEAQLVADNTLNPGAPLFLWERFHGHHRGRLLSTTCWSLTEFLAEHEDWTSTSEWRPAPTERQLG